MPEIYSDFAFFRLSAKDRIVLPVIFINRDT